jgi:hypothetical protein
MMAFMAGSNNHARVMINSGITARAKTVPYYHLLWIIALTVTMFILVRGIGTDDSGAILAKGAVSDMKFLLGAYDLMIPLTIITALRRGFDKASIIIAVAVVFILTVLGSRYRVLLLMGGLLNSYYLFAGSKPRIITLGAISIILLMCMNFIHLIRTYGLGFHFDRLSDVGLGDIMFQVGGEASAVFIADRAAKTDSELIFFDPWIIGLSRLIPSALWPDKPVPDYLARVISYFDFPGVESMGLAPPQLVEVYWQFGWVGIPLIGFAWAYLARSILTRFNRESAEINITAMALVPWFFGYYLQSRGYFSQVLNDFLFIIAPLYLLSSRRLVM